MRFLDALTVLFLSGVAFGHPGELGDHDAPRREQFLSSAERSVASCQDELLARGHVARAIERRATFAEELRGSRRLPTFGRRTFKDILDKSHMSNRTGLTSGSTASEVFSGNLQCVLQGEVTEGPYYVEGELVRSDIVEGQMGVPLYTEYQLIDVTTCEPLKGVYLEAWHTNATGVYGGVINRFNGNSEDYSNLNNTMLRGIVESDRDGVSRFMTIFPGHYTNRTSHIHLIANVNATLLPNNTLTGGHTAHVGQAFFDQSLINEVEKTWPYNINEQPLTLNSHDSYLQEEAAFMDPIQNYVYLGNSVSDGILAWLTIGVNPSDVRSNVSFAVDWTASGGVINNNSYFPTDGTWPSGGVPPVPT